MLFSMLDLRVYGLIWMRECVCVCKCVVFINIFTVIVNKPNLSHLS